MKELNRLYEKYTGKEPGKVISLTGSGSNRSYFRMFGEERSLVGVVGTDVLENKAFITLAGHFREKGINVPEVVSVSDDGMRYLQEDLGRTMLSDMVAEAHKNGGIEQGSGLEAFGCIIK